MFIHIDSQSEIPIYAQLTNQIIEGIARGYLLPGDSLPSVRAFAADLSVNMHTVHKSYQALERKGIIRLVPKSGAVICKDDSFDKATHYERLRSMMQPVVAEAVVLGMKEDEIQEMLQSILKHIQKEN